MDEEAKKRIDELRESDYFDYMVERAVKERVARLMHRFRVFAIAIATVATAILSFFGFSAQQLYERWKEQARQTHAAVSEYNDFLAQVKARDSLRFDAGKYALELERQIMAERQKLDDQIRENFDSRLRQLDNMNLSATLEDLLLLRQQIVSDSRQTEDLIARYQTYKAQTDSNISALTNISDDIKKASVRYVFVERGSRRADGREYRPARIRLPYSNDVLEARFHTNYRSDNPKRALVDIYGNGHLLYEDLLLTDSEKQSEQSRAEFCSIEGLKFRIEPVIIYLPPNFLLASVIPGYGRIPDYVIFGVRLVDMACSSDIQITAP